MILALISALAILAVTVVGSVDVARSQRKSDGGVQR